MADDPYLSIAGTRTYVIEGDALDWALLSRSYQPRVHNDLALLWSNTRSPNDYLEFEIDCHDRSKDEDIEDVYDICHICNISLPKAYIQEHIQSSKHKAYQKIADTAAERVRRSKKLFAKGEKNELEYFCEYCVSVIRISKRDDHERSKQHKDSVTLDEFLNNIALFYTNEKNESIDHPRMYGTGLKVRNINYGRIDNLDFDVIPFKVNEQRENTSANKGPSLKLESKLKDTVELMNDVKSYLDNTHEEINNNFKIIDTDKDAEEADVYNNLKQYIKLLKRHGAVKLYTMDSIDQDRFRIETSDGFELIVSSNNFHGFKRSGKKNLQCKLCNSFVNNVNDHKVSEKHITFVSQEFEDKHCLRIIKDSLYHCVVCNEVTDNADVHILFNEHIRKLEQALVPKSSEHSDECIKENVKSEISIIINANKTVDNKNDSRSEQYSKPESEHYCATCNMSMHINNVATHLSGTKHIFNSKTAIYYVMRKDKTGLVCKICNINVSKFVWAVEDHIVSADHVKKYYNFLASNKVIKANDMFFCEPCGEEIAIMTEIVHVESQTHKIKLASYSISCIDQNHLIKCIDNGSFDVRSLKNDSIEDMDGEGIIETDASSNKDIWTKDKHLLNKASTIKICDKSKYPNKVLELNTENLNSCSNIMNQADNPQFQITDKFADKSDSINHSNKKASHKTMNGLLSGVNSLLEELLKYFIYPPEVHSHLQRTDIENVLKCKVCFVNVLIEDTDKHINSLKHVHAHRDLMTVNKIKFKNDRYLCYPCNVYVESYKEIRHIESADHEKRLESLTNGDYVLITAHDKKLIDKINHDLKVSEAKICERKASNLQFSDFIPRGFPRSIINDILIGHYFRNVIDSDKQIICVLCQMLVTNTKDDLAEHIEDINHQVKHERVMIYNQIFQTDAGFACGFCEMMIPESEYDHIINEKHLEKQKIYPNKNYCFTCKVSSLHSNMATHVRSEDHIKNINSDKPNLYYCNVCDLKITKSETNIERHIEGFQHKNNVLIIDYNKVVLKSKKCFCHVCECDFSRKTFEEHIGSRNHLLLLDEGQ